MRIKYTNDEKVDMTLVFGKCGKMLLQQQISTKENIPLRDVHPAKFQMFRENLRDKIGRKKQEIEDALLLVQKMKFA